MEATPSWQRQTRSGSRPIIEKRPRTAPPSTDSSRKAGPFRPCRSFRKAATGVSRSPDEGGAQDARLASLIGFGESVEIGRRCVMALQFAAPVACRSACWLMVTPRSWRTWAMYWPIRSSPMPVAELVLGVLRLLGGGDQGRHGRGRDLEHRAASGAVGGVAGLADRNGEDAVHGLGRQVVLGGVAGKVGGGLAPSRRLPAPPPRWPRPCPGAPSARAPSRRGAGRPGPRATGARPGRGLRRGSFRGRARCRSRRTRHSRRWRCAAPRCRRRYRTRRRPARSASRSGRFDRVAGLVAAAGVDGRDLDQGQALLLGDVGERAWRRRA